MTAHLARLTAGRRLAESIMADTVTVLRPSTSTALDTATGLLNVAAPSTIYRGSCRVRMLGDQNESTAAIGERHTTTIRFAVWMPVDVPEIRIGDLVQIDSSDDPQLSGRRLRVVSVPLRTHLFRRTAVCELDEPEHP